MLQRPRPIWWIAVLGGMALLAVAAYGPVHAARRLRVVPVPATAYRVGLWLACAEHVRKSLVVHRDAVRADLPTAERRAWVAQTTLLGYPSARLFRQRAGTVG